MKQIAKTIANVDHHFIYQICPHYELAIIIGARKGEALNRKKQFTNKPTSLFLLLGKLGKFCNQ
jgi:hypothetical protein